MNKRLLSLALSLAFFTLSYAQEVPEVQKTLLTKVTATWCPNCGTWGWTFFEDIIMDNSEKAVFVGAHHGGNLESDEGVAFSNNFMAPYQPYFYAGNQDVEASPGNASAKRQEVKDLVDANFLLSPMANVGFEASILDNVLTINAKTKFFQEASGSYYLGVYILEHNVISNQASNSSMAMHPYVLRASFTPGELFGNELVNGDIVADTEFTETLSLELNPAWDMDNITVAGIIWEFDGTTYQYVNVNTIAEFSVPSSVSTISEDLINIELFPTIATDHTQLNVNLKDQSMELNIQLFDLSGQAIRPIFQGELTQGMNKLDIATNDLLPGLYLINIQTLDGAVATKKLIIQ